MAWESGETKYEYIWDEKKEVKKKKEKNFFF